MDPKVATIMNGTMGSGQNYIFLYEDSCAAIPVSITRLEDHAHRATPGLPIDSNGDAIINCVLEETRLSVRVERQRQK
jgi:hypothetical protein